MICCCEKCRFVFEGIHLLENCPDCGGGPVREATLRETADYFANRKLYGPMQVYGQEVISSHKAHLSLASDKDGTRIEPQRYLAATVSQLF